MKTASPNPTVNLQPLPTGFRLSVWKSHHVRLNGEYLPLDDGSKQLNQRPIFQHGPVVGILAHQDVRGHRDECRLYWTHGAWRIGNVEQLQSCIALSNSVESPASTSSSTDVISILKEGRESHHTSCTAFIQSNATHPSAISTMVGWKATASEHNPGTDFEFVEGVNLAKGMVRETC